MKEKKRIFTKENIFWLILCIASIVVMVVGFVLNMISGGEFPAYLLALIIVFAYGGINLLHAFKSNGPEEGKERIDSESMENCKKEVADNNAQKNVNADETDKNSLDINE